MHALKEKIIAKSKELGIDKIGFTTAQPFNYLEASLIDQKKKGRISGFEHKVLEERLYPELIFDQPQSIISIALAYPAALKEKPERVKGERRGQFARASWGEDYHFILADRQEKLINFIKEETSGAEFKPMVDTGELIDVAVAQRAGLGFVGKNGLLITPEYGSWVYLGEIITNLEFAPDEPMESMCGDCTRCLDSCPTQALLGDGRLNAQKCLSYQSQTKGYMPEDYRRKNSNMLYGCDICQQTCPFNKGIDNHFHAEMEPEPALVQALLKPLLTISNRDFKESFGPMAGSWRGKKPIQRNAIIALGNYRDRTALPQLLELIEKDLRPVIRGTAAWAISKILRQAEPEILNFLTEVLAKEEDPETIMEFSQAIERIQDL